MKIFTLILTFLFLTSSFGQITISNVQNFSPACGETQNSIICSLNVESSPSPLSHFTASILTTTSILQLDLAILTNDYSNPNNGTNFVFYLNFGPYGLVNEVVEILFTDSNLPTNTLIHQITFSSAPALNLSTTSISMCRNDEPLNLSNFQDSYLNGRWNLINTENFIEEYDPSSSLNTTQQIVYSKVVSQCLYRDTLMVNIVTPPQNVSLTPTASTSCAIADGLLILNFGGTGYNWSLSNGETSSSPNTVPTLTFNNLKSGSYIFRVSQTTAPFCRSQAITDILAPDFMFETTFPTPISCFGDANGSITASIINATPGITFLWNTGATTPTISNLEAGEYRVKATNTSGCSIYNSWILTQPAKINPILTVTRPNCNTQNGIVGLQSLDGAAVGTSTVNWTGVGSPMGTDIINVGAGSYTITVQDINGCSGTKTIIVSEQNSIPVLSDIDRPNCNQNNGNINVTPLTNSTTNVSNTLWSNGNIGEDMIGVSGGTYSCLITSNTGCKSAFEWNLRSKRPLKQDICLVTVDTVDNLNIIVWQKPVGITDIDYYNIYREIGTSGTFQLIDTVRFTSLSEYKDSVADSNERSWRYKISAVNDCGIEGPKSDRYKTMQRNILIPSGNPSTRKIIWDAYEGSNTVSSYLVYRRSLNSPWTLIQTIVPSLNTMSYIDTPSEILDLDYFVETAFITPCLSTQKANSYRYSRSNKQKGVVDPGAGLNELALNDGSKIIVYPNPVENELIIETDKNEIKTIAIIGIDGKVIKTFSAFHGKTKVDVSTLSSGSYLIHFVEENNAKQLIFIKK
jgi:trimeric autotransporter adhesin